MSIPVSRETKSKYTFEILINPEDAESMDEILSSGLGFAVFTMEPEIRHAAKTLLQSDDYATIVCGITGVDYGEESP